MIISLTKTVAGWLRPFLMYLANRYRGNSAGIRKSFFALISFLKKNASIKRNFPGVGRIFRAIPGGGLLQPTCTAAALGIVLLQEWGTHAQ